MGLWSLYYYMILVLFSTLMWFVRLCRFNHIRRLWREGKEETAKSARTTFFTDTNLASPRLALPRLASPHLTGAGGHSLSAGGGGAAFNAESAIHTDIHVQSEVATLLRTKRFNAHWATSSDDAEMGTVDNVRHRKPSTNMIIDLILSLLFFFHNNKFYCNVPF